MEVFFFFFFFLNVGCLYDRKTQRVFYQARSLASSKE